MQRPHRRRLLLEALEDRRLLAGDGPPNVVSVLRADANPTNAASVGFTVTFDEPVKGVDTTDFRVTGTSQMASVSDVSPISESGVAVYRVNVLTGSGDGTIRLDVLDNNSIRDLSNEMLGGPGNNNGSYSTGESYTIDKTTPMATAPTLIGTPSANAAAVEYNISFSEPVTGVDVSDFLLAASGISGAAVSGVTGSGTSYVVALTTGSGEGTLQLALVDDDTIVDAASNPLGGDGSGTSLSAPALAIDLVAPQAISISTAQTNPTNAELVDFTVTFSEAVVNVGLNDFVLTTGGDLTGAMLSNVVGTGASYTVSVNTGDGDGTIQLGLSGVPTIDDAAGNAMAASGVSSPLIAIDKTSPVAMSTSLLDPSPTNASSVRYRVTFAEPVVGLSASNLEAYTSSPPHDLSGLTISSVTGSGTTYEVTVTSTGGSGPIFLRLVNDGNFADLAGNQPSLVYGSGPVYMIDRTAPAIESVALEDASPTNAQSLHFLVTFNEPVLNFGFSDIAIDQTGLPGAYVSSLQPVSGTQQHRVTVVPGVGEGSLSIDVLPRAAVADYAGNPVAASATNNPSYTVDTRSPVVTSITRVGPSPTNASSIDFAVTFSEPVVTVSQSDFNLVTSGVTGAVVTQVVGSGSDYTISVTTGSSDGTIRLDAVSGGTLRDLHGNGLGAAATGPVAVIDHTPPSVLSFDRLSSSPTSALSVDFRVVFSEAVTGVDLGDFAVSAMGVHDANIESLTGSGTTYDLVVTHTGGAGTLGLRLVDNDSILDAVQQPIGGSGSGNGDTASSVYEVATTGTISGRVVHDVDQDGYADFSEVGLAGATVYVDSNENGQLDLGEPFVTTVADDPITPEVDESGRYSLIGLPPEEHRIRVSPPVGWLVTNPAVRLASTGELDLVEIKKDGVGGTNQLDEAAGVTQSPDGNFVYVAAYNDDAITVFSRNPATGGLTQIQQLVNLVGGVQGLVGAQSIAITSDGTSLYVASAIDNALAMFSRDVHTGLLTYQGHLKNGVAGVDGLGEPLSVRASEDGRNLYVAANTGGSLAVFHRDPDTGLVTFAQKLTGSTTGSFSVDLSPDQRQVYLASTSSNAVTVYNRDLSTGLLGRSQTIHASDSGIIGLSGPAGISVSPDGANVYVATHYSQGTVVFNRHPTTGLLTFNQFVRHPFSIANPDPIAVLVSPDGHHVVTTYETRDAIAVYSRNPSTGQLTLVEAHQDGLNGIDGLNGAWDVEFSGDNRTLYVVGAYDDTVVVFDREVGGLSSSYTTATVTSGQTITLPPFAAVNVAPMVESITHAASTPVTSASIEFDVLFSEPVFGVDPSDFEFVGTFGSATPSAIVGSGAAYTLSVDLAEGFQGTLSVRTRAGATITDTDGVMLGENDAAVYDVAEIDRRSPSLLAVQKLDTDPTNRLMLRYQVDFSESVTGFDAGDLTIAAGGVSSAAITSVTGSGSSYVVTVTHSGGEEGTIAVTLSDDDSIVDAVGRPFDGAGTSLVPFPIYTVQHAIIEGVVFSDVDEDGVLDADESGAAGMTVFVDLDQDGVLDADEPTAVTRDDDPATPSVNEAGRYSIGGLTDGTYTVVWQDQSQWRQSLPGDDAPRTVNVAVAEGVATGTDFGIHFIVPAEISGQLWSDYDQDGRQDLGETGVAGLTVYVDLNENGLFDPASEPSDLTAVDDPATEDIDETGQYRIASLAPGSYTVRIDSSDWLLVNANGWNSIVTNTYVNASHLSADNKTLKKSPDGKHLYVFDQLTNDIVVLAMPQSPSETLTQIQVLNDQFGDTTNKGGDIAFSPGGNYLYMIEDQTRAVAAYQRNLIDGTLVRVQTLFVSDIGPYALEVAPDGNHLYVAGGYIARFTIDPLNGTLSSLSYIGTAARVADLAFSSDGTRLYATDYGNVVIRFFSRDVTTGAISQIQATGSQIATTFSETTIGAIEISDDDRDVYVAAPYGDIVWHFQTLGDGTLVYAGHYPLDADGVRDVPLDLQLSPDGEVLFVALGLGSAVQVMHRDLEHGGLTLGTAFGSEDPNLLGVNESSTSLLDISDDGRTVVRVNSRAQQIHAYTAPPLVTGIRLSVVEGRVMEANQGIWNPLPTWASTTTSTASPTNASSIVYEVTFSEGVTGVDASDFQLQMPGISGAVISSVVGGPTVYTVTVDTSAADGHGELVLRLADDDSIVDATDGPLGGLGAGAHDSVAIEVDLEPPTVTAVTALDPVFSSSQSVRYLVEFSESFCLVDKDDFVLIQSGVAGASVSSVSLADVGTGTQYVVVVDTGTGDGTVQLQLVDDDTIVDRAGNPLAGTGLRNGDFLTAPTYTIERNPHRNVSGFLFNDANGNGIQDDGEPPLGDVVVYADLNRDGVMDAGDPRATSGIDGNYTLSDIPIGDVVIRINDMTRWLVTTPHSPVGRLFAADNANLYELNPQTGAVMRTHSSLVPPTRGLQARGVAFDGHSVFLWEDVQNHILVVNPETGSVTREITTLGTNDYHGLAILGMTLYALDPSSDSIVAIDSTSGAIVNMFDIPQLNPSTPYHDGPIDLVLGLGESADGRHLIAATQSRNRLVIDPSNGLVVDSFVDETSHHDAGLAGGDGRMFVGVPWVPEIEVHDSSGQRLRSLPLAGVEGDRAYNLAYGAIMEPATAVALDFGPDATGIDFGLRSIVASVSGIQFEDLNVNGIWDSGEPPLSGVTVFADVNGNGFLDSGEPSTLSAGDGTYTLRSVPQGIQTIRTISPVHYQATTVNASSNRMFGAARISDATSPTGYTLQIRELDPISGLTISSLDTPLPVLEPWSVAFDGNRLLLLDNGLDKVLQLALDGTLLAEAALPGVNGVSSYAYGVAIIQDTVYVATTGGNLPLQLVRFDRQSNQFYGAMPISRDVHQSSSFGVMPPLSSSVTESIDGRSIWLFSNVPGDTRVFEVDPLSARITSVFNLPGTDGNDYGAATVGGELLLRGQETGGRLNVYNEQLTVVRNTPSPNTHGLAGGVYLDTGKVITVEEAPINGLDTGHRSTLTSVSGSVSNDLNGNGVAEPNEGAAGLTVYLDANRNGFFDSGELAATTLTDGSYAFEGLVPGDYTVRVHQTGESRVSTAQTETALYAVQVASGVSTIRKHDSITGQVLREFPAPSAATTLAGLAVNEHGVYYGSREGIWRMDPDTGEVLNFFPTSPISLDGLASVGGYLFGQNPFNDTITKFHPLTGVALATFNINAINGTAYNLSGNLGESTNGTHLITRLPSGGGLLINPDTGIIDQWFAFNYGSFAMAGAGGELYRSNGSTGSIVVEAEPEKLIRITPVNYEPVALGAAVLTSEEYSLRATTDTHFEAIDFMLSSGWPPASISGSVWNDIDGDGVRDSGEAGLADVTVYLDLNGDGLANVGEPSQQTAADDPGTTDSDETGYYRFEGVAAGVYQVRQQLLPSHIATAPMGAPIELDQRYDSDFTYAGFQHHPTDDLRLSATGRYLVYSTLRAVLPVDTNTRRDIYLLDRSTNTHELISINNEGVAGNGHHFEPDVSADGRYVIYRSGSTNLDPADTNSNHDIYVRDRQLGTTSLLTKGPLGNDAGGYSADALITPDGQKVLLYSFGANLIAGDTNGRYDTFMWDRTTGTFERISVDASGAQLADNESYGGDVSADGRYVVFESRSAQLIAGDTNLENDIYWKDRVTGEIRLVSSSSDGTQGNHKSQKRSISDDGRWVVFDSLASNLTSDPHPEDGTTYHVYLKDMQTGETTRISKPQVAGTYNAGNNQRPEISGDGRFIVFESDGMLLPDDTNQRVDVYLYDRESGAMHLISRGDVGTTGDGYSNNAVISADGSTIAFTTSSTNVLGFNAVGGIVTVDTGLALGWHRVSLLPGIESSDNDFGQRLVTSEITGTLWDDQNNNGMMDASEPRLAGRTVYLDSNNDGVLNPGESSRLTSADDPLTTNIDETGSYSFTGLLTGEYQVRQVLPSGWTQTAPLATDELARLAANGYSYGQNTAAYPFFDSAASDNGRFVAFTTTKSMLPVDTNNFSDLYVMDRSTGDLEMISVSTSGLAANGASYNPSISGDGRFVAFRSFASNFSSIDANNTFDVFVRDRLLGTTTLISSKPPDPTAGELGGNSYSYSPTISRDGSVVTFWSNASNLVAGDSNAEFDLFLKNLQTGALQRINVDASGNQALGGPTHESLPSHDGRFVGYWSRAVNLVAGDTNGAADVFLLNRQTGVTERVSVTQSGVQGNASSDHFSMSDDARFFVFQSDATNFTSLSGLQGKQVYLKDRQTGELNLISTGYDGAAPTGASLYPAISDDGRWIVYHSWANNLVPGDTNGSVDVFLYDRTTAITTLLSRSTNGTPSNGPSDWVRMSRDGSTILFNSAATNLVAPQPDASGLYIYQTSSDDPFVRTISLGLEQTVADANFGSRSMVDLGSAPESYGTSLESGGPHHLVDPDVRLGSALTVDSETGHPALESDNDGVGFTGPLIAGLSLTLDITTSTAGHLAAWIDFDRSGTFDADERSEFLVGTTSSVTSISIAIPANAAIGNTYSRFRFSTDQGAIQSPTGLAPDGEVEDYAITIQAPTAPTDLALSSTSINENRDTSAADLFFAELSAVDGDLGDTHTYSLVSGPGDADNARFVVADDQLFIRQGETIDYETQSSYTIRVRVTDATGLVYEKPLQLDVNNLVELSNDKILIGNGTAQRSRVETVSIEFDSEVEIQDGAFIVTRRGAGGGQVGVSYQLREGSGNRIVDLTFSGDFVEYGSLVDGNYELTVVATKIIGTSGFEMDGDQNGSPGGDLQFGETASDKFFRFYGDVDGDRDVDYTDLAYFRRTLLRQSGDPLFNAAFDYDNDADVDYTDYAFFRRNLLKSLTF